MTMKFLKLSNLSLDKLELEHVFFLLDFFIKVSLSIFLHHKLY